VDKLEIIFNKQRELMEKYHHIEVANGLCQTEKCPVDLNDPKGQARIKDFAWRFTEELGESMAHFSMDEEREVDSSDELKEELIDGLHFLTELSILAGLNSNTVVYPEPLKGLMVEDRLEALCNLGVYMKELYIWDRYTIVNEIVRNLAMTCNELKNRPWKQTFKDTNVKVFHNNLKSVWAAFFALLSGIFYLSADDVLELYIGKNEVNKQRQENNY
jgi:dimeric dUTPase (all-alpha-NTP-PPase superfamily)